MRARVYLNDIDVLYEYGYYMTSRSLGIATPNTYTTSVVGMDGILDYTDFFGDLTYNNRTIEIELTRKHELIEEDKYKFVNDFNGKNVQIIFEDDLDHYYQGRLNVKSISDNGIKDIITITIDAHPFKYSIVDDSEVRDV